MTSLTTEDVHLDLVKSQQEEGQAAANKSRDLEQPMEEEAPVDVSAPVLHSAEPDKDYHVGDSISKSVFDCFIFLSPSIFLFP